MIGKDCVSWNYWDNDSDVMDWGEGGCIWGILDFGFMIRVYREMEG